jgi:DNA polymerase-1
MKYLLIDAFNLIFRSFYAIPLLTSGNGGVPVNAVIGFVKTMEKLKKTEAPDSISVFFDSPTPSHRRCLYSVYKANRKDTPRELIDQVPLIKELCEAFGYGIYECPGAEADDIIATAARKYGTKGNEVLMFSNDKDLAQCVSGNILLVTSSHDKAGDYIKLDELGVVKKFGVTPSQIVDYLSLVGDACDNIRGVDGIGPKTAAKLLREYGTVDSLFANINQVTPRRIMERLLLSELVVQLNRKIISLDDWVCAIELFANGRENTSALQAMVEKYSLHSLAHHIAPSQQELSLG